MKKIKALRQFSHFHEGNFSQGETRSVSDEAAHALVAMGLAELLDAPEMADKSAAKPKGKK